MPVAVRTLDDGAWISINDSRAVSNSGIWPLTHYEFCDCEVSYVLLESFYDVGVDRHRVLVGAIGQCIECGRQDSIDDLAVGRIVDGEFHAYEPSEFQSLLEPDS
ncbi:hypothetical protein SAMN06269185_1514 [Natronoarchaeum philippinense]|uniref:DUF8134 domain-containing protein n=1 Tax=Natronoarchaeum philippinense TaxID=558529 RepID=A0A285NRN2_NATPI|nr:hypothetical protein [Natronoarchaeum philippinense]SNZ12135.1 hypothetical protein SAMN06269185_1514 [Natronoarchaeum philippinense]